MSTLLFARFINDTEIIHGSGVTKDCNKKKDDITASLTFDSITAAENGDVRVIAKNRFGEVKSDCQLIVNCKLTILL